MRLLILLLFVLVVNSLRAQQTVSGKLTTDTEWGGTVAITGDVIVPRGVTLSIRPGTRINISAKSDDTRSGEDAERVEIKVLGKLLALGSGGSGKIFFTSAAINPQMNDWYGIIIKNQREKSLLNNCVIEYGYKGVTCYGSSPEIVDSEIRYHQLAAISTEVRSVALIRGTTLMGNDFAGIICELAARPIIEESIITQNSNGIIVFDRSQPDLGRGNPQPGESRGGNLIFNNFDYSIYNQSGSPIYAQNNLWNTQDLATVRQTLYDRNVSPSKGEVLITPLMGGQLNASRAIARRNNAVQPPAATPAEQFDQPVNSTPTTGLLADNGQRTNVPEQQTNDRLTASDTQSRSQEPLPSSADATPTGTNGTAGGNPTVPEGRNMRETPPPTTVKTETLVVYREAPKPAPVEEKPVVPKFNEPVMESFLDGGQRQYLKRVKAIYPDIYRKTKHEGKVLFELVIGRDGKIESQRIIRSDGEYFVTSAREALSQYRYKPATIEGQPVSYKIVEPFVFRLSR